MIGQSLSHFRITAKIGEGGMGEVYRAEDTRLGREVALKVLPEALTADPERLARLEREAKVLASLNHPNIAGIHQLEQAEGRQLLVMELVEGEDLAERLARGPIPAEEALAITHQIAQGLEAAHAGGIVHRDLKPANVKIKADGQVKILDFGLAKAHEGATAGSTPDLSLSPTLTAQMTQAGVILGSAAYMSPEQARGQEADARSDLWALGVVLHEMLTGERLFTGPTVSDTLAAVLRAPIAWEALPAATPRGLKRLLGRCLERDPRQRYHAAADLRLDLEEVMGGELDGEEGAAPAPAGRLPWILAAVAAVAALGMGILALLPGEKRAAATSPLVASLLPPTDADFVPDPGGIALSPDGTRLAFVARDANGIEALWLRPLDRGEASRLPGTEGAQGPFWSPDGRSLGFTQDRRLKTLALDSGLVEFLAPQAYGVGGAWGSAGDIVFSAEERSPLQVVKQSGGESRAATEEPPTAGFYFGPDFLPDGEHFVFHSRLYGSDQQVGQIRIGSLDGSPSRLLFESYSTAFYAEPGFIVWWQEGNLRARRFDPERLELVGEPFGIASGVRFDSRSGVPVAAASDIGRLVYQSGGRVAANQLTWYSRAGEILGTVGEAGSLYGPRISPDGARIALDISGDSNQGDIWLLDAERGSGRRLTVWPEDDSAPVFSPDGQELVFFSARGGLLERIFRTRLTGAKEPELVLETPEFNLAPLDWSRDGRTLLYVASRRAEDDIWALTLESGETRAVVESEFDNENPALSPDGRWLAYDSNETGRSEIYLTSFPDAAQRVRVSEGGGRGPLWSPDGKEIFFASLEFDAILRASVSFVQGQAVPDRPQELFAVELKRHTWRQFDTVDGERFLVNRTVDSGGRVPLTVVEGWEASAAPANRR